MGVYGCQKRESPKELAVTQQRVTREAINADRAQEISCGIGESGNRLTPHDVAGLGSSTEQTVS